MSSVFNCENCNREYTENSRKPLSIPCGHVFCEECVWSFVISRDELINEELIICPKDNKTYQIEIKKIPCCHQILANLPHSNKEVLLKCARHPQKKIKYHCVNHSVYPCSICVVEHTGNGHDLQNFKVDFDSMNNDYKNMMSNVEKELHFIKEVGEKFEKAEKICNDYFTHQQNKLEKTFERAIAYLNEKKRLFYEEIKISKNEIKKRFDVEKEKMKVKSEKVQKLKVKFSLDYYEMMEKKNFEEFLSKKREFQNEIKLLPQFSNVFVENIPFAYYSNTFVLEDIGSIKFYKSFQELDHIYSEKKQKLKVMRKQSDETHSNEKDFSNIFQNNLLNNRYDSNSGSPSKSNPKTNERSNSLNNPNFNKSNDKNLYESNKIEGKSFKPDALGQNNCLERSPVILIQPCKLSDIPNLNSENLEIKFSNKIMNRDNLKKDMMYPFSLRDNLNKKAQTKENQTHCNNSVLKDEYKNLKVEADLIIESKSNLISNTELHEKKVLKRNNEKKEEELKILNTHCSSNIKPKNYAIGKITEKSNSNRVNSGKNSHNISRKASEKNVNLSGVKNEKTALSNQRSYSIKNVKGNNVKQKIISKNKGMKENLIKKNNIENMQNISF